MKYAPDPRESKLPAWAQKQLAHLRLELTDALKAAEEARLATSPDESNAVIDRFPVGSIGLGNATVTFKLGDKWHESVAVRVQGAALIVNGAGTISVQPSASNAVQITMRDQGEPGQRKVRQVTVKAAVGQLEAEGTGVHRIAAAKAADLL